MTGKAMVGASRAVVGPVLACLSLAHLSATPAWAYLDPGSASLGFQALLALVLGALYALRAYLKGLWAALRSRKSEAPALEAAEPKKPDEKQLRG